MAHNHHMLAFAAMMTGQSREAIKAMDEVAKIVPRDQWKQMADLIDGFMCSPLEGRIRFGKWQEILEMPLIPEYLPFDHALQYEARAVAYAALGFPEAARAEQALFFQARKRIPKGWFIGNNPSQAILKVAAHMMNGEILLAERKYDACIAELRKGIVAEDQLGYDEPPDWLQPVRHTLGAVLVKIGRFPEAERVYREDLKRLPNNGWSLYGLAKCLKRLGRDKEAVTYEAQFARVWAKADMTIDSSCLCVKG